MILDIIDYHILQLSPRCQDCSAIEPVLTDHKQAVCKKTYNDPDVLDRVACEQHG